MKQYIFLILFSLFLVHCQTQGPQPNPNSYTPAKAKPASQLHNNFYAEVIDNSANMLLLHLDEVTKRKQIFIENSLSKESKRITYSKADQVEFKYNPVDKKIYYTSTMDETQENPIALLTKKNKISLSGPHEKLQNMPATEIYSISLNHSKIVRRTYSSGFDGDITLQPSGRSLVYSKMYKGRLQLYSLNLKNNKSTRYRVSRKNQRMAQYSLSGKKIAWIEFSDSQPHSEVFVSITKNKSIVPLHLPQAVYLSPSFLNDNTLLFSANIDEPDNFEIYAYTIDKACLKRLTFSKAQDLNPTFIDLYKQILFVSEEKGQSQVYLMDFVDYNTCPRSLNTSKM